MGIKKTFDIFNEMAQKAKILRETKWATLNLDGPRTLKKLLCQYKRPKQRPKVYKRGQKGPKRVDRVGLWFLGNHMKTRRGQMG